MSKPTNFERGKALALFLKQPRPGAVKTRLAATIGTERAAAFYHQACRFLLSERGIDPLRLAREGIRVFLFFDIPPDSSAIRDWFGGFYPVRQQRGGNLGERMADCFAELFREDFDRVILIGSDCLELGPGDILEGFAALQSHDLTIGPAHDGGYYLIGQRPPHRQPLFDNLPWSTAEVLPRTLAIIKGHDYSHHLLKERGDIDTLEDLRRAATHPSLSWLENFLGGEFT